MEGRGEVLARRSWRAVAVIVIIGVEGGVHDNVHRGFGLFRLEGQVVQVLSVVVKLLLWCIRFDLPHPTKRR